MLLEPILGYKAVWRVITLMAETPRKEFSRSLLKEHTKLGNEALSKALERLQVAKIIVKEKKRYSLNLGSYDVEKLLILVDVEKESLRNLPYVIKRVLTEFIRKVLEKTSFIEKIVLFGSHARGTATKDSDIDIAMIVKKKELKEELKIEECKEDVDRIMQSSIQMHVISEKEFRESKKGMIKEIKEEGINLYS